MYTKRVLPFDLWLGEGSPIDPYHYGLLVDYLRSEVSLELRPIPVEAFPRELEYEFCEYTMIRCWVKSWLRLLKWYCEVALSGEVRLEDFCSYRGGDVVVNELG